MAKKVLIATLTLLALSMIIPQGLARLYSEFSFGQLSWRFPPIVSTDCLECNLDRNRFVAYYSTFVLDVRGEDAYNAGHIPGAINVPEGNWYVNPPFASDPPWMEIPPKDYLFELIGNAGITRYSWVVVVGATSGSVDPMSPMALYAVAGITRVAMALLYAGVRYVSILDGGYDKWAVEGKPTTTDPTIPTPVTYTRSVREEMLVSAEYVESKIGTSIIVDARDWVIYCGIDGAVEPWALDPGHISTARNLPAPTLWDLNIDATTGNAVYITYKDTLTLSEMVSSVVGRNWCVSWFGGREIIVYCGVGGYASTVYFVLTEVLQYRNVRIYDGSAQEWYQLGNEFVPC